MRVDLFGHNVTVKTVDCSCNGNIATEVEPYINLYVRLTDRCDAACPFCCYSNKRCDSFNAIKFIQALEQVKDKIRINKISITGGEPTIMRNLLDPLLWGIRNFDPSIFIVVNSNGYKLKDFPADLVDSLSISKHHYIRNKDSMMFGCRGWSRSVVVDEFIADYSRKDTLHLSCNLATDYIDTPEEIYNYLSYYSNLGVTDFGFVSLMPVTTWAKKHFVDGDLLLPLVKNTTTTKTWKKGFTCRCSNHETITSSGIVNSYTRRTLNHECVDFLVWDIDTLKLGFNGPTLF